MHLPAPHVFPSTSMPMPPQQRDISSCPPSTSPALSPALRLAVAHSHMSSFYSIRSRGKSAPPFPTPARRTTLPSLTDALALALAHPPSSAAMKMDPIDGLLKPSSSSSMPNVLLHDEKADLVGALRGSISPMHHLRLIEKLKKDYPLDERVDEEKKVVAWHGEVGVAAKMDIDDHVVEEEGKESRPDSRIKCHCGRPTLGSSSIIPCTTCRSWSHVSCYSYDVLDPMLLFQCYACQPRFVKMEETDLGNFKQRDQDVEMEMEMEERVKESSSPLSDLPASSDSKTSSYSDGIWSTPSSPLSSLSSIAYTSELEAKASKGEESGDEEDGEYELDGGERSNWIVPSRPIHPLPRRLVPSSLKHQRAPPRSSHNLSQATLFNRNAPSPEPCSPKAEEEEEDEIYHVGIEDDKIVKRDGSIIYLTREAFKKDAEEVFMRDSLGIRPELKNTPNTITLTCRNGRKEYTSCEWELKAIAPKKKGLTEDKKIWIIGMSFLEHNEACGGRVMKPLPRKKSCGQLELKSADDVDERDWQLEQKQLEMAKKKKQEEQRKKAKAKAKAELKLKQKQKSLKRPRSIRSAAVVAARSVTRPEPKKEEPQPQRKKPRTFFETAEMRAAKTSSSSSSSSS